MDEYLKTIGMIYRINIIKKEPIWFSKLVKVFDGDLTKGQVSRSLDRLYDLGLINMEYQKLGDVWTLTITVSSESERFAREMNDKLDQQGLIK